MTDTPNPSFDSEPHTVQGDAVQELAPDLAYMRVGIVNVLFYGNLGSADWVLIDAGLPRSARAIVRAAEARFGEGRPKAIVLTHGHFDHVGALEALLERWNVAVYAHTLELPYLDGRSAYAPPDPGVGGGAMARLSGFYPNAPTDVKGWLRPLPEGGEVPEMPEWRWLATPGHTPGHVSLWRERDKLLVSGDAVVTTRAESAYAVMVQRAELSGPPAYYTPDWVSAEHSVHKLAKLEPETLVSGHGPALRGEAVQHALYELAENFRMLAVPERGRYVNVPARADTEGLVFVPDRLAGQGSEGRWWVLGAALLGIAGYFYYQSRRADSDERKPGKTSNEVTKSITIMKPASELYSFWRALENLPRVMRHLESVVALDEKRSRWTAKAPLGSSVTWDAEITDERENETLAWRSLEGADVHNAGRVTFKALPHGRGTQLTVSLTYEPPLGQVGALVAKLMGDEPSAQLQDDLRRFRQQMETGEQTTVDGQTSGRAREV